MPSPRNKPLIRQTDKRRTPEQREAHRKIAFVAIRRLYCDVLPLWRGCRRGYCRRHKRCAGDGTGCLKRVWPLMPSPMQERAFREVVAGGPRRVPPASDLERSLRSYPPSNFVR